VSSAVERDATGRDVVLRASGLCLEFNQRSGFFRGETQAVLRGIDLDLRRGETLGILGHNGCGKSTLLRVLAGILAPAAGRLEVEPRLSRAVLAIGLGFRNELSGRDNAYLSAMLQGASRREARANLARIREFSELGDAFERPVGNYSSGMRARLGFAASLITQVDILFIDEVLAVGDGAFRHKAAEALKSRIRSEQSVVLVSHNLGEIRGLADRVAWIDGGRCVACDAPSEVLPRYRDFLEGAEGRKPA